MKNPFKNAETADEFLSMLRKELEKILGRKFRYWKTSQVWVDVNGLGRDPGRLCFTIDADRIQHPKTRYHPIDWYQLAEGDRYYDFPKSSRIGRWHGFGPSFEIHGSSGGSGAKESTYRKTAYVYLKYLPKLAKIVANNEKIRRGEIAVVENNAELRALAEEVNTLGKKLSMLTDKLRTEYRSEHPTIDPINGRTYS
jgi:hypothetical protein